MTLAQADIRHLPLPAESIDMIFTDPPYGKATLLCYEWLAQEAARVLRPGGFVLAMCGGYELNKIIRMMDEHLIFYWELHVFMSDVGSVIWPRRVIARNKAILAYSNGEGLARCNVLSGILGGGNDKRYHHWGQDVESARYYIDCFSKGGDLVLDPFLGSGTTAIACELIGRRWLGFDIDPSAIAVSAARLRDAEIPYQGTMFSQEINA